MLSTYQSMYANARRWSYRNFGRGHQPKFKSLFNASFILVMLLTPGMLLTELIVKLHLFRLSYYVALTILFGEVLFMVLNYFMLLNNDQFKRLNDRMSIIGKRNLNGWAVLLLVNVILACGIFILAI